MKSDISIRELKRELEKLNLKSKNKTGFLIFLISSISIIIILILLKLKCKCHSSDFYKKYDEDLEDEFYEDYYALDYEEE